MTHSVATTLVSPLLHMMRPHAAPVGFGLTPSSSTLRSAAASAASGSTTTAPGGLGSTFLNLLVKELQNQDPTAPMDSTAMVGQMISLNQLDQLISINQKTATGTKAAAAINGMTAAKAVIAPATQAAGQSRAASGGAGAESNAALQLSKLLRFGHGGISVPADPGFGGAQTPGAINDFGAIGADDSAFAIPGFSDISGGK